MIDWMKQYIDIAGDGFKAELLWLAYLSNEPPPLVYFSEIEWQAFAHSLFPEKYTMPLEQSQKSNWYCIYQSRACFSTANGIQPDIINIHPEDNYSQLAHKVIWMTGFGKFSYYSSEYKESLIAGLVEDNDTHALCCIALILMGCAVDLTRCNQIKQQDLNPANYHEIYCATVATILSTR